MLNQEILAKIQDVMDRAVAAKEIAGANVLVEQDGSEQYYGEAGYADVEQGVPVRRDTLFRLYSMSKPVTGAAVMLLLERGELDLLDPVSRYIPAFAETLLHKQEPLRREITIKDLLGMTSGLPYGGTETAVQRSVQTVFDEACARLQGERPMGTLELASRLAACGSEFQPGTVWMYGTSADILGAVVEAATKKSFGTFLREEFFEPLGMKDTGFYVPPEKQPRLSKVYACKNGELLEYTDSHLAINHDADLPPAFESGGAGLLSTADDYMKFASMLLRGGISREGKRILSPKTVEFFSSPQLTAEQRAGLDPNYWGNLAGYSYGNLMRVLVEPGQAVMLGTEGEYGWDGWLGTYFCNSPRDNLSIVLMMQKTDTGTDVVTKRVRNLIFSSLEA